MGRQIIIPESEYKELKRKANANPYAHEDEDKKFLHLIAGMLYYSLHQAASVNGAATHALKFIIDYAEKLGYTELSVINPQTYEDRTKMILRYVRKGKT